MTAKIATTLAPLAAMLFVSLLSSCSSDIEMPLPPLSPSSSSAAEQKNYCIYPEIRQCYYGTYSVCPGTGDIPGKSCPYSSSSSIQNGQSSSGAAAPEYGYCVFEADRMCLTGPLSVCPSGGIPGNSCPYRSSSSAAIPGSSAAAPSSSSECIGSGSYCYYGGCSQWDSDGWSCLRSVNGMANQGGCYPMPTDDDCLSGTLVSTCPAGAIPPAANYCELPPSGSSSSASLSSTSRTFTDSRDGKVYKWVKIGEQVWMAENLNYAASGSKCGNGNALSDANTATCNTYGRLYDWATAMAVCPSGWHLPSDAEWDALMQFVNPSCSPTAPCANAGGLLKATSGWNSNGNGTDTYDFSALPGGSGYSGSDFYGVRNYGYWWSASEHSDDYAYGRDMSYNNTNVNWFGSDKSGLFSVRCLQD